MVCKGKPLSGKSWALSYRMKRDLAIHALEMAVALRQPPKGCIHHTDRSSQYCSNEYQKRLTKHGFKVSMSGKGIATPLGIMLRITLPGNG
jgi:transposase InsO family protein